ncbi:hypothetical protein BLNAU_17396 [Blattamonas nauphoetae]|uniref:VASt domain-containing protein n=1 Tax=Blattamonas nauphoetae TaxID=2049346 RepID=A0ABQ9X7A4_9EUKA|nr:hypothetical protein BLNAU_17396 [Blattamonas nauphoetae]
MMNTTQPTPTTPTLRQRIPYIVRRYSTPTKEEQSQVDSPASTTSESLPRSQDKTPKSNPQIFSEPQPSSDQLLWPSHSPHTFEIPKEPTSPLPKERVGSTSPSLHPLMPNLLKKEKKKQAQILKRSPTSQSQILASPTISPTTIIESPEYPSPQPSLRGLETAQNQTTDQVSQAHSIPLPSVISPSGKVRLHLPPRHSILHIPFLAYLPRPPSHPPPKPDEPILRPLTTPYFHHIIPNLTLIQFLLNAIHYSSFIHFIFFRSSASAFPKAEETNAIPPFFLTTSERDAFIPIEPQENVQPSSALSPVESTPIVAQEDPITLINGLLDSPLSVGGTNQQFDWVPFTPDPPSTTLASFKRVINYVAPTNANIGPPSTHTRETHELHHFSPTHSVYTIRLDCLDVPYASHFYYFQKLVLKEEEYDPAHLEIENPVGAFDKDADAIMTEKANQNMPYLLPEVKKSLRIHATFDVVIVKPFIIQAMFTKISTQKSVIIDTELANFFRKVSLRRNTSRLLDWKRIVAENTTPEEIQSILNVEQASIFSDVSAVASSGGETHKSEQGPKTTSSSLSTFPPPSPVPEEPKEVPKQSVLSSITSLAKSCENVVVETIRGQNLSNTVQEVWRVVLMVVVTLIVVQMIRTLSSISTATEQQIQLQQQMLLSLQKFDERMNQQAPQNAHVPAVDT